MSLDAQIEELLSEFKGCLDRSEKAQIEHELGALQAPLEPG